MKTVFISGIIFAAIVGWFLWSKFSAPESDIVAKNGLHWHPELKITILDEVQEIPAGIGLGFTELPIHTHAKDGIIHLEFSGLVKTDDIRLGKFFQILGKTFNKNCIFDKCSGGAGQLKMLVNGQANFEFENYIMKDGDKIEIIFKEEVLSQIKEIIVSGTEFSFNPETIFLKAGEKVKITFQNQGSASHNLIVEGLGIGTKTIGSGKTDAIEFISPSAGTYNFFCSIPGHRASGMAGQLIVE